jgi:hypothetical protein
MCNMADYARIRVGTCACACACARVCVRVCVRARVCKHINVKGIRREVMKLLMNGIDDCIDLEGPMSRKEGPK